MLVEVLHDVRQNHFGVAKLLQGGDQRKHDPDIAQCTGSKDCPQLGAEHRQMAERQPNAPQAEKRVVFILGIRQVGNFISAQVEGADGDRLRPHRLDNLRIGPEVILFVGLMFGAKVQEFGAVQSHAVRPAIDAMLHLVRETRCCPGVPRAHRRQ